MTAHVLRQAMMLGLPEVAREDLSIQVHLEGWNPINRYSVMPDGPPTWGNSRVPGT